MLLEDYIRRLFAELGLWQVGKDEFTAQIVREWLHCLPKSHRNLFMTLSHDYNSLGVTRLCLWRVYYCTYWGPCMLRPSYVGGLTVHTGGLAC